MPKISIITAVYNVADTLERAVFSVRQQTFSDWELLLIDDGSSDESLAICRRLAESDSRIRVFHHENRGVAYTRNVGLREATGEYWCVLDPDDYYEPDALAYLAEQADHTGADVVLCGLVLETGGRSRAFSAPEVTLTRENLNEYARELKASHLLDTCVDKLYCASFVKAVGATMPVGEIYEDTAFNLSLLLHPFTMVCRRPCFYHYVQRPGSITKRYNPDKAPVLKKRWQALCQVVGGNRDYCAMYYLKSVFSVMIDEYLPAASLTARQRAAHAKALTDDEAYRQCLAAARGVGRAERLTLWVARRRQLWLVRWYCRVCYFLKYRLSALFLRLK